MDTTAENPELDALNERIRSGDGEALGQYLAMHQAQLTAFIRSICSDRLLSVVEPDDLMQEVATAALTSLPTAPLDRYDTLQWLHEVSRRRVVDAHRFHFEAKRRDAGRQQSIDAGSGENSKSEGSGGMAALLAASMTSPSAAFSRDVRLTRMQQAIMQLPEDQQQVVRMRYAEGMPTKDIAEKLGKSDVSIRVMLSRCMRQLEKELEDVRPDRR